MRVWNLTKMNVAAAFHMHMIHIYIYIVVSISILIYYIDPTCDLCVNIKQMTSSSCDCQSNFALVTQLDMNIASGFINVTLTCQMPIAYVIKQPHPLPYPIQLASLLHQTET